MKVDKPNILRKKVPREDAFILREIELKFKNNR